MGALTSPSGKGSELKDDSELEDGSGQQDDSALLERLRNGDHSAYTELWRRHVGAALRLGRSLSPGNAEDLVSESFLAVYQQVAVSGAGPVSAFRAYLFTVMRNTSIRWHKENSKLVALADDDLLLQGLETAESHPLELLEKETTSAELLDAMEALPERWQRVLWLTEVEGATRGEIAGDLGIKPNAVSALYRRARSGLRMNWLTLQIPVDLRTDTSHVAHLLPRLIVDGRASGIARSVKHHTNACDTCQGLYTSLQADFGHMRKITLSLAGFLALGGTAPALAPLAGVGGTAVAISLFGGTAVAAGIGLLLSGSLAASIVIGVLPGGAAPRPETTVSTASSDETDNSADPANPVENGDASNPPTISVDTSAGAPDTTPAQVQTARLGQGNTDPSIQQVEFRESSYVPRPLPERLPAGTLPPPAGAEDQPAETAWINMQTPPQSAGYIAPTISGATAPGGIVVVEVEPIAQQSTGPAQYAASTAPDGSWYFAFATLFPGTTGTYHYRVWGVHDEVASAPITGEFTVSETPVFGFESVSQGAPFDPAKAADTGIVFEAKGLPNGYVCLISIETGQESMLPLDKNGSVVRRIRFLAEGTYWLEFRACEEGNIGPSSTVFVDVLDPDTPGSWGPWGPDPTATEFILEEV